MADPIAEMLPEELTRRHQQVMTALDGMKSSEALTLLAYITGSVIEPLGYPPAAERTLVAQISQSITKALAIRRAGQNEAATQVANGQ